MFYIFYQNTEYATRNWKISKYLRIWLRNKTYEGNNTRKPLMSMKIFFHPDFTGRCHQNIDGCRLGQIVTGEAGLLKLLQDYSGIHRDVPDDKDRLVTCLNALRKVVSDTSPLKQSFDIDPMAAAAKILEWRDELVLNGWSPSGEEEGWKLGLIASLECEGIKGTADQWAEMLRATSEGPVFPQGTELIVPKLFTKPVFLRLLENLKKYGTVVSYLEAKGEASAGTNLGIIQSGLFDNNEKIILNKNDDTFNVLHFETEDEALKYVATMVPASENRLFVCSSAKRLDNIQTYLGQPHSGSAIENSEPQIVQLFKIGMSLFQYPSDIGSVVSWLQAPVSPLGKLRFSLLRAVKDSGGLFNEEWDKAITYERNAIRDNEDVDESERKKHIAKFDRIVDRFIIKPSKTIEKDKVIDFCGNMSQWAVAMSQSEHYQAMPGAVAQFTTLKELFGLMSEVVNEYADELDGVTLRRMVIQLSHGDEYAMYNAECGGREVIASPGDILDPVSEVVWVDMYNASVPSGQFSFLTVGEKARLGCEEWQAEKELRFNDNVQATPIFKAKEKLTLIYTDYADNAPVAKHPLLVRLGAKIENFKDFVKENPEISDEAYEVRQLIDNYAENTVESHEINLRDTAIPSRRDAESYSSLDSLVQHPFDYVCNYAAALREPVYFDKASVESVKGNVAHRTVELMFSGRLDSFRDCYDKAVQECGALLFLDENVVDRKELAIRLEKGVENLQSFIKLNNLTFIASEKEYSCEWKGKRLTAKVDMILKDGAGNPVILDFKNTSAPDSYKKRIARNEALQLAVYKYVVLRSEDFSVKVARTAYVILPDAEIFTSDDFAGVHPVAPDDRNRTDGNLMELLDNSFDFRWKQLEKGVVELGEGLPANVTEYGRNQSEKKLIPIKENDQKKKYDNIYSNVKGLR